MVRFLSWVVRCRRPLPLAAAALIAILVAGLVATPAAAHASLISSSPPDGAAVATAPTKVELIFSEEVGTPSIIAVTGPDGVQVVDGPTQIRSASVVQPLKTLTAGGLYKIAYRVVSADGHPVSGQLTFTYAPPGSDLTASHQGRKPATGAADGHGAHFIALGILVLAAVAASVIALRKDRQYDRAAASTTPATVGEATPGAVSTGAPDTAASDTAVPDSAVPDSAAADPATGNGAKKQPAR